MLAQNADIQLIWPPVFIGCALKRVMHKWTLVLGIHLPLLMDANVKEDCAQDTPSKVALTNSNLSA